MGEREEKERKKVNKQENWKGGRGKGGSILASKALECLPSWWIMRSAGSLTVKSQLATLT